MAFELHRYNDQLSVTAASSILPKQPVRLAGSSVLFALPCATNNVRPFAVNGLASGGASGLDQGEKITVYEEGNIVKAVAAASLGVNAEVAVGSPNGALIPIAIASGVGRWAVGVSLSAAAEGETFSLYVMPRQTGSLA